MRKTLALTKDFNCMAKWLDALKKNSWNMKKCRRYIPPTGQELRDGAWELSDWVVWRIASGPDIKKRGYQTLEQGFCCCTGDWPAGNSMFYSSVVHGGMEHIQRRQEKNKKLEKKACVISLEVSKYTLWKTKQSRAGPEGSKKEQTWKRVTNMLSRGKVRQMK